MSKLPAPSGWVSGGIITLTSREVEFITFANKASGWTRFLAYRKTRFSSRSLVLPSYVISLLYLDRSTEIFMSLIQCVHIFFKRHETYEPIVVLPLTVGVPLALAALYFPHAVSYAQAALVVVPFFWTSLLTSISLYRLSPWHPLARYPGPLLCKLSKFHLAFISLGGKQHIYIKTLHERYGDVVRVGMLLYPTNIETKYELYI